MTELNKILHHRTSLDHITAICISKFVISIKGNILIMFQIPASTRMLYLEVNVLQLTECGYKINLCHITGVPVTIFSMSHTIDLP
jgi:hypothetical protein